jgi:Family of unknown function (DUF6011)
MKELALDDQVMIEIRRLADERDHRLTRDMLGIMPLTEPSAAAVLRHLRNRPVRSAAITDADRKAFQRPASGARPLPREPQRFHGQIPDGRYAITSLTGNNDLDFFQVRTPADGKWQGFTFVDRIIGGHDPAQIRDKGTKAKIFAAIREMGPEASQLLAARELGICMDCGHELTDEESRAVGRGPVCRSK